MIAAIRIKGMVGINKDVAETLDRLRLRRKYACVAINPTKEQEVMIKKMRNFIAYGEISNDTFEKLIKTRGKKVDKTKDIDPKKVLEGIQKGKKYEELNLKPFFRLHPPRGGAETKIHYPRGILGDNQEKINDLILRML